MIKEFKGDLLKSGCDVICHQVNLQYVMGGGIAKQIALRYPSCEEKYKNCNCKGKDVLFCRIDENKWIANCFSQNEDFTTNYEWLEKCVDAVKRHSKSMNIKRVGIPKKYGCGIASGDWEIVKKIWCDAFENEEKITLEIWEV